MSSTSHAPYYFVPAPSKWPAVGSLAMIFTLFGAVGTINSQAYGPWALGIGLVILTYMFFGWFGAVIAESESGQYNSRVDASFRWSMSWFIFSEVMFFAAFFGALWWARVHSVPALGNADNLSVLWPDFKALWPSVAEGVTASPAQTIEPFVTMSALWLPTINTALLLSSGVTITIAHHALRENQRGKTITFMWLTVLLGSVFLICQGYEYYHAYHELNLKLTSGIYGSTFFMLTGFHGFHVFMGTLMLLIITLRLQKGHFTADRHFGFEGAAWYWHFVDVVWLGLYVLVYWL